MPWENGIWAISLVTGNEEKKSKIKNGNGMWALRSGILKNNGLGNGIGTVFRQPRFNAIFYTRNYASSSSKVV